MTRRCAKVVDFDQFDARAVMDGVTTESALQAAVLQLAVLRGWRWFHSGDSRRDPAGFPDLVLVRGDRVLFVELKTQRGRLRQQQAEWLLALSDVRYVTAAVWRPSDMERIEKELR